MIHAINAVSPFGIPISFSFLVDAIAQNLDTLVSDPRLCQELPTPAEIERLTTLLPKLQTSLLRLQNAHAAINRLPVEVLANIFNISRASDWNVVHDNQSGRVVRMSLVCHHWRQVALLFPSLWSTIQLRQDCVYDFQFADLCLARSRSSPLTIVISTLFRGAQIAEFVAPYASRIREVALLVPYKYAAANLPAYVVSTCNFLAPNLETLRLCAPMWNSAASAVLPPLFGGEIPRIKRLHIESFTSWPGHAFTGLTHLTLGSQTQHDKRAPMAAFLDLLQSNPLLEELLLDDGGPALDACPARAPVSLPRLRLLCITVLRAELALPARILAHLALPPHASIRVFLDMNPALSDAPPAPFPADTHALGVVRAADRLLFRDAPEYGEPALRLSALAPAAGLAVSHRTRDAEPHALWAPAAMRAFLCPPVCVRARALWLDMGGTAEEFEAKEWEGVLGALTLLEEVVVVRHRVGSVLAALRAVKLPALAELTFLHCDELDVGALEEFGRERKEAGCPLSRLVLSADMDTAVNGLEEWFGRVEVVVPDAEPMCEQPMEMLRVPFGRDIAGMFE